MSIRRACRVLEAHPKMYRYKSRRSDQASLKERIKGIAETRVRYGYRRIHVLLRRVSAFNTCETRLAAWGTEDFGLIVTT